MGGGDLNLKKSWHPSTLRNIERVWKAEQKHEAEQQKIEQLQKELAEERAREEIQTFAEDQGVVRKKEEKLDWMYQGPAAMLNKEEFLLGRKIDNTFEKMQLVENGKACEDESTEISSSVFSSQDLTGTATVDLANKIREDPLFNIMKKEKEQRKNLLTNPVKMKQLQQMLKASLTEKSKKKKKKSKKKNRRESDSDDETHEKKKHKKHKSSSDSDHGKKQTKESKKHMKRKSHNDFHSESEDSPHEYSPKKKHKHSRSPIRNRDSTNPSNKVKLSDKYSHSGRHNDADNYRERYNKSNSKHRSPDRHVDWHFRRDYSPRQQRRVSPQQRYNNQRYNKDSNYADRRPQNSSPQRKIDKEEAERLLKEMQENAQWRERQRKKNTERYREEDEAEDDIKRVDASDFVKPMLSKAAGKGSLENRVKQKIFSIQRSSAAMDKNFARRE